MQASKVITDKHFKELEIILTSFTCDKNCPYCTAKITQWPVLNKSKNGVSLEADPDDIHQLFLYAGQLYELGYTFDFLTIGGNGEPTLHPLSKLKEIVDIFAPFGEDRIKLKRVLTSGNIFRDSEVDKYNLFVEAGWVFEVTVTSSDRQLDMQTQGYNFDYFNTEQFKKAPRVRLNYTLLNRNRYTYVNEINWYLDNFTNIETAALKYLNINTLSNNSDTREGNKHSEWIRDNSLYKTDASRESIAYVLNQNYEYIGEKFDTHFWKTKDGREIHFSWKKVKQYGKYDLVYFNGRFVDYQLNDIELQPFVKKVYIASKFVKTKNENGTSSFKSDFRVPLIGGNENDFVDFNNHSFIRANKSGAIKRVLDNHPEFSKKKGEIKYQYIGPFWNEKASDGTLSSTDCVGVVNTENNLIERCDIFVVYLNEDISQGSITEMVYAAMLGKDIYIFYKPEEDVGYSLKSCNWYPITFCQEVNKTGKVKVYPVKSPEEIINVLENY